MYLTCICLTYTSLTCVFMNVCSINVQNIFNTCFQTCLIHNEFSHVYMGIKLVIVKFSFMYVDILKFRYPRPINLDTT